MCLYLKCHNSTYLDECKAISEAHLRTMMYVIVNDILSVVIFFEDVSFFFVRREGNSSAYLLALWAAFWHRFKSVPLSCPLAIVVQALERDGSGLVLLFVYNWSVSAFFTIK